MDYLDKFGLRVAITSVTCGLIIVGAIFVLDPPSAEKKRIALLRGELQAALPAGSIIRSIPGRVFCDLDFALVTPTVQQDMVRIEHANGSLLDVPLDDYHLSEFQAVYKPRDFRDGRDKKYAWAEAEFKKRKEGRCW